MLQNRHFSRIAGNILAVVNTGSEVNFPIVCIILVGNKFNNSSFYVETWFSMNRAFHNKQVKLKNNERRLWDSALRTNHRRCSIKKCKKNQWGSLLLMKLQSWRSATLLKRDSNTLTQVFFCGCCEIFKNIVFEKHRRTTEYSLLFCVTFFLKKKSYLLKK